MTKASDAFELEVKGRLELELQSGALGLNPATSKVYHKKGYHSAARGADIIFDVSVEVFRPGATEPFLLWLWECKNYGHRVPVDDVEEFQKKLDQIGPSRAKGTMITRHGFQQAAVNVARSWGIGLVRLPQSGIMERLFESVAIASPFTTVIESGLTDSNLGGPRYECYAITGSAVACDNFRDYLSAELDEPTDQDLP